MQGRVTQYISQIAGVKVECEKLFVEKKDIECRQSALLQEICKLSGSGVGDQELKTKQEAYITVSMEVQKQNQGIQSVKQEEFIAIQAMDELLTRLKSVRSQLAKDMTKRIKQAEKCNRFLTIFYKVCKKNIGDGTADYGNPGQSLEADSPASQYDYMFLHDDIDDDLVRAVEGVEAEQVPDSSQVQID